MTEGFRDFRQRQRGAPKVTGPSFERHHVAPEGGIKSLTASLAQARICGTLSLSNRGIGPKLPPEVSSFRIYSRKPRSRCLKSLP